MALDQLAYVAQLRQLRDELSSDRQRQIVDVVVEHAEAEIIDLDIDRLMATMVDEPRHEFYGLPGVGHVVGYNEVRSYYLRTFSDAGPHRGTMEVDRFVVGDDALVKVGTVSYTGLGFAVRAPELAAQLDLTRPCVVRTRMCLVMPFDGDRIISEMHFFDGPFSLADVVIDDDCS